MRESNSLRIRKASVGIERAGGREELVLSEGNDVVLSEGKDIFICEGTDVLLVKTLPCRPQRVTVTSSG